jgi:cystathionine beta-lyase
LVQTPVYPPILKASENARVIRQESPLERVPDGSYRIDWEVFENAITPKTRVFILCNPHNPVGRVFRRLELERMAQICLQRGVVVCSDEIHGDLIYEGQQHLPIASLDPDIAQNTITLMAPSKTYNLPGLQCSFAIIQNKTLRDQFCAAMDGLVRGVNLLGMVAMVAAYQFCDEWLEQLLVYLQSNRDYLFDYVQGQLPGIKMAKPEGTYLAWLDCREAGIESNPCEFFLEKGRLALNDGLSFGQEGEGFVRMNFGCPRSLLEEGLERMKTALQSR